MFVLRRSEERDECIFSKEDDEESAEEEEKGAERENVVADAKEKKETWVVVDERTKKVVAAAVFSESYARGEEDDAVGLVQRLVLLYVLPEYRRQGIATRYFGPLLRTKHRENLLFGEEWDGETKTRKKERVGLFCQVKKSNRVAVAFLDRFFVPLRFLNRTSSIESPILQDRVGEEEILFGPPLGCLGFLLLADTASASSTPLPSLPLFTAEQKEQHMKKIREENAELLVSKEFSKNQASVASRLVAWFEERGISYITTGGTALGLRRYGCLLPWDDDVDFTIHQATFTFLQEEMPVAMRNDLWQRFGLAFHDHFHYPQCAWLIANNAEGIHCDVFCTYFSLKKNKFLARCWEENSEQHFIHRCTFEQVVKKERLFGWLVPSDLDSILERCYPGWRKTIVVEYMHGSGRSKEVAMRFDVEEGRGEDEDEEEEEEEEGIEKKSGKEVLAMFKEIDPRLWPDRIELVADENKKEAGPNEEEGEKESGDPKKDMVYRALGERFYFCLVETDNQKKQKKRGQHKGGKKKQIYVRAVCDEAETNGEVDKIIAMKHDLMDYARNMMCCHTWTTTFIHIGCAQGDSPFFGSFFYPPSSPLYSFMEESDGWRIIGVDPLLYWEKPFLERWKQRNEEAEFYCCAIGEKDSEDATLYTVLPHERERRNLPQWVGFSSTLYRDRNALFGVGLEDKKEEKENLQNARVELPVSSYTWKSFLDRISSRTDLSYLKKTGKNVEALRISTEGGEWDILKQVILAAEEADENEMYQQRPFIISMSMGALPLNERNECLSLLRRAGYVFALQKGKSGDKGGSRQKERGGPQKRDEELVAVDTRVVWQYWENRSFDVPRSPALDICDISVLKNSRARVVCVTPDTLGLFIPEGLPREILCLDDIAQRSDYIRVRLLAAYGGAWLDSDTLVVRPLNKLWRQLYGERLDLLGFSCGSAFSVFGSALSASSSASFPSSALCNGLFFAPFRSRYMQQFWNKVLGVCKALRETGGKLALDDRDCLGSSVMGSIGESCDIVLLNETGQALSGIEDKMEEFIHGSSMDFLLELPDLLLVPLFHHKYPMRHLEWETIDKHPSTLAKFMCMGTGRERKEAEKKEADVERDEKKNADCEKMLLPLEGEKYRWGALRKGEQSSKEREKGITFMIRAKNEETKIANAIQSLKDHFDGTLLCYNIVFVDNGSTDKTKEIAESLLLVGRKRERGEQEKGEKGNAGPESERAEHVVKSYPLQVCKAGLETYVTPCNSAHSLPWFYEWCKQQCVSYSHIFKWDADFRMTPKLAARLLTEFCNDEKEPLDRYVIATVYESGSLGWESYIIAARTGYTYYRYFLWECWFTRSERGWTKLAEDELIEHDSVLAVKKSYLTLPPWWENEDVESEVAEKAKKEYEKWMAKMPETQLFCRAGDPACDKLAAILPRTTANVVGL